MAYLISSFRVKKCMANLLLRHFSFSIISRPQHGRHLLFINVKHRFSTTQLRNNLPIE